MNSSPPAIISAVHQLASEHGLELEKSSIKLNEMGLDFRVAIARAKDGDSWVLRIPRRADVLERIDAEAALLRLVSGPLERVNVAVPDWLIHTTDLIAYPLLPGTPGLEISHDGQPLWRMDPASGVYAQSLGKFLAALHDVDRDQARATGIDAFEPSELRQHWRDQIEQVKAEFEIKPAFLRRWDEWLSDDSYWPDHTVVTHGEIYPGHTLIIGEEISAVLDWTTAAVHDPAKDFMFHHHSAPANIFQLALKTYVDHGGKIWPRFADHCAHMFSTGPVGYGIFALLTGDPQHRESAAALLNPASN